MTLGGLEMVRYRVSYTVKEEFNCLWQNTEIIESDEDISRKEIARRLNISVDSIVNIEVI